MTCFCYSAHAARHRCSDHLEFSGHVEDLWVEANNCRVCFAEKLDKLEAELEMTKARWRNAQNPKQV